MNTRALRHFLPGAEDSVSLMTLTFDLFDDKISDVYSVNRVRVPDSKIQHPVPNPGNEDPVFRYAV